MRVAVVAPYPAPAEGERHAVEVIRRDSMLGELLMSLGHEAKGFKATRGVAQLRVEAPGTRFAWTFFPIDDPSVSSGGRVVSTSLVRAVTAWEPDFVLLRGAGTSLEAHLLEAYRGPYGVIIGGRFRTSTLASADVILTESDEQVSYLSRRLGGERLQPLTKYVEPAFFEEYVHPAAGEVVDVLTIGRFEKHKNHHALKGLFDRDLRITMVGDGSLRPELLVYAQGRRAVVSLPGEVPSREVLRLLRRTAVLAHPSRSEGFPRAVAEAMAVGVPSVCFAGVVGPPLVHDVNGVVVDSERGMCDAILGLLADDERRCRLGDEARRTAQLNFSLAALQECVDLLEGRMTAIVARGRGGYQRNRFSTAVRRRFWDASTKVASAAPQLRARAGRTSERPPHHDAPSRADRR